MFLITSASESSNSDWFFVRLYDLRGVLKDGVKTSVSELKTDFEALLKMCTKTVVV